MRTERVREVFCSEDLAEGVLCLVCLHFPSIHFYRFENAFPSYLAFETLSQ